MTLRLAFITMLLALATAAGVAAAKPRTVTAPDAPRSLPEQGPVSVRWTDPAQFSELRFSGNPTEARRGNWVVELAEHLRASAAARLPAGERLEVTITDIKRAGEYEPGHGIQFNDVRVIRDLYPPRMTLTFTRTGADGAVLAEGERTLTDPGFLINASAVNSSDPLRFEKQMIDQWLRRELAGTADTRR